MKLETKKFKLLCSQLLTAIETNDDLLTINYKEEKLYLSLLKYDLNITLSTEVGKQNLNSSESYVINAKTFLKLISSITQDDFELSFDSNFVRVKFNKNEYKLAREEIELESIKINNKILSITIKGSILNNIVKYNSFETKKTNFISRPVQSMFYVDNNGCITFSDGGTINSFSLDTPFKILLDQKIVNLFKLFKEDSEVSLALGYDQVSSSITQSKIQLTSDNIDLVAITSCNDTLLTSVPVEAIKNLGEKSYDLSIVLNKNELSQACSRLLLFSDRVGSDDIIGQASIDEENFVINAKGNIETIHLEQGSKVNKHYEFYISIKEIKEVIDTINDTFITLNCGDNRAFVIVHNGGNVRNILPERRHL